MPCRLILLVQSENDEELSFVILVQAKGFISDSFSESASRYAGCTHASNSFIFAFGFIASRFLLVYIRIKLRSVNV